MIKNRASPLSYEESKNRYSNSITKGEREMFQQFKNKLFKNLNLSTVYVQGKDLVPSELKTEAQLSAIGYRSNGPVMAILKTKQGWFELFDQTQATPQIKGADFTFKGFYFSGDKKPPFSFQPEAYFQRHQLLRPEHPIAKRLIDDSTFEDLYEISEQLNDSQKGELLKELNLSWFDEPLCHCSWRKLEKTLKTAAQLKELNLPTPKRPLAKNYYEGEFYNLYDLNEAQRIQSLIEKKKEEAQASSTPIETSPTDSSTEPNAPLPWVVSFEESDLVLGEWVTHPERYVILDTETTGLFKQDEIIQLSVVQLNGQVLYNQYFKPTVRSHPKAYQTHKISQQFLADKPTWAMCWPEIESLLKDKVILIHNSSFDKKMMNQTCQRYGITSSVTFQSKCTLKFFNRHLGIKKLETILTRLNIQTDPNQLHNAVVDCQKTAEALQKIYLMTQQQQPNFS